MTTIIHTNHDSAFDSTIRLVTDGIGSDYSCASVAVGRGDQLLLKFCAGNRQDFSGDELHHPDPRPVTMDTLYDMASVSKLMSTTMVALRLWEMGEFSIYDSLWRYFDDPGNFRDAEIRHLMTHTSGITPHIPLYARCGDPSEAVGTILHSEPLNQPGEQVHYSCMGYMILKEILERITGSTLDGLAKELVFDPLAMGACYNPVTEDCAATEFSHELHRYKCGQVHDENAYFMGGVSGNAGVFASIDDMAKFGAMISGRGTSFGKRFLNPRTFELAVHDYTPGMNEDRGLGFQLRGNDLSASGDMTSPDSYGHNGYTGTSVYCDGKNGIYMVLLTNSVHYGRDNRANFFRRRRLFHNLALSEAMRVLDI